MRKRRRNLLKGVLTGTLAIFILILSSCHNSAELYFKKGPYLIYTGNTQEMKVLWQLTDSSDCALEWGTDTDYAVDSVQSSESGTDHMHSYTIKNLVPGTRYYYRLTLGSQLHTGSFLAGPPQNATRVKFMVYSDSRTNAGVHNSLCGKIIKTYTVDPEYQTFILHSGDLVTNGNRKYSWKNDLFDPSRQNIRKMMAAIPIQACMGNHERNGKLFVKYFPYTFARRRYRSFDYGPVHVVVVDQYTDYRVGSSQYTWIEDDLSSASRQ